MNHVAMPAWVRAHSTYFAVAGFAATLDTYPNGNVVELSLNRSLK